MENNAGNILAVYMFFTFDIEERAKKLANEPKITSINPKGLQRLTMAQANVSGVIYAESKNAKSVKTSDTLNCIGPKPSSGTAKLSTT